MASLLITSHAVAIGDAVFVLLGVVQLVATILVLSYATKYEGSHCAAHPPLSCTEPSCDPPNDPVGLPGPDMRLATTRRRMPERELRH